VIACTRRMPLSTNTRFCCVTRLPSSDRLVHLLDALGLLRARARISASRTSVTFFTRNHDLCDACRIRPPAWCPSVTLPTDSWIKSDLLGRLGIWLEARFLSLRGHYRKAVPAPRPAASTAALSAEQCVANAISSITLMYPAIRFERLVSHPSPSTAVTGHRTAPVFGLRARRRKLVGLSGHFRRLF